MFLPIAYYNRAFIPHEEICISPLDLGVQRGYSVFDFFKIKNLSNPWFDWYYERLLSSCEATGIQLGLKNEELLEIIQEILKQNETRDAYIKVIVSAGKSTSGYHVESERSILMLAMPISPASEELYKKGGALMTSHYKRDIPNIKTTNYMHSAMLAPLMKEEGFIDVLYHYDGLISEASRCNFFIVKDGIVYTPGEKILQGITRKRLLSMTNLPSPIVERDIKVEELSQASESFITSTTKGILPIVKVDDKPIGAGIPGPTTLLLMERINTF